MENKEKQSVYTDNGYENRRDYLESLAQEYDPSLVFGLADMLGSNEDFDGLVTALEDYDTMY